MDLNGFVEIISYVCGGVVTIKFTVMFLTFSLSMRNLGSSFQVEKAVPFH